MTSRLTDKIGEWLETAVELLSLGDQFQWDMAIAPMQTGPNNIQPGLQIMLFLPGAVLDTTMSTIANIPNPGGMTQADCQTVVRNMMEQMRGARSQQVNGASSGLILRPE